MQAVILAGGAGSRLRSVVSDRPKAMAAFGNRPFLEYQVESLRRAGITDFVLCVGYLHEHIEAHFGDGRRWGVRVRYAVDNEPLGTGGALRLAATLLASTFLLINGDSYLELQVDAFLRFHSRRRAADPRCVGTVALTRVADVAAYGAVSLDADQRLVEFGEKSRHGAGWVNAGVYVLERSCIAALPARIPLSLEREGLPAVLAAGLHVYGYTAAGFFVDIGTPAGHHIFRHFVEDNAP